MSGFTPAGGSGGTTAAPGPSNGFSVKARTTAKARHKDDQARVTAHARSVGRTGKAQGRELGELAAPLPPPEQEQVPLVPRREGRSDEAREHVRRDIGSHVAVFELGAPDSPADLSAPFTDPQGAAMRWAVRCLTHGETRYLAGHRSALQSMKGSHAWCPGCAAAAAGSRRVHNRARAQLRRIGS
jgi:hypothetical protein